MNESSNRSVKFCKDLDNEARQKLCQTAKKGMRTIWENLDDEKKYKLR